MAGARGRRRRAETPDPAVVVLDRKRIYILPTRHGLGFVAALVVMLTGSLNYASSLGYLLTFLLGSIGLVSMLHTYRNLAGLRIRVGQPEAVFAGQQARVPVTLDNRGGPPRHALLLTHPVALPLPVRPPRRGLPRWWPGAGPPGARGLRVAAVGADRLQTWTLPVAMSRRGSIRLRGLAVATRYPLGLFRGWTYLRPEASGLVYPAPSGTSELPTAGSNEAADATRTGRGREDFSGLREYQQGDSPKHIHWKAVARGLPPPIKLFEGAGLLAFELDWDATAHLSDVEARLGLLARWVLEAERRGAQYALRLPGGTVPHGVGGPHRGRCLRALALFPDPAAPGARAAPGDVRHAPAEPPAPAPRISAAAPGPG